MFEENGHTLLTETDGLFKTIHIKSNSRGPHVLITAGVHGDEYEPVIAAKDLAKKIKRLLIAGEVTIVPLINVAAFKLRSRTAEDGLDLARICPGNPNGSISERVAAQISGCITEADFYIDMHTGGRLFNIYPMAGYMLHSSAEILDRQRAMAMAFNLPVVWGTDSAPNGRTLSVARDANVPAIYIEYGGGESLSESIIKAYEQGCINVLASLNMLADKKKQEDQVKYLVEDYTSNNGYLQGKLPAPCSGFFIPLVSIGQSLKKGALWGWISSISGDDKTAVFADIDGVVLFLRTSTFVHKGDALGGILPIIKPGKITIHENK